MASFEKRFQTFHADNPHVYKTAVSIARQLKKWGIDRIGFAFIYERMRWLHIEQTRTDEFYKLNNSFRARYARLIMDENPDLAGFFPTRKGSAVKAKRAPKAR